MRYQAGVQYTLPELGIPSRKHRYTYGVWEKQSTAVRVAKIMAWLHDYIMPRTTRDYGIVWYVVELGKETGNVQP